MSERVYKTEREKRMATTLMDAIQRRVAVMATYNQEVRAIEPHLLGETTAGNLAVRVWQLGGGSLSQGQVPGWRLMRLDRMIDLKAMDSPSLAPRPEYNPDDGQMTEILARV